MRPRRPEEAPRKRKEAHEGSKKRTKTPWLAIATAVGIGAPVIVNVVGEDRTPTHAAPEGETTRVYRTSTEQHEHDAQIQEMRGMLMEKYKTTILFGPDPDATGTTAEGLTIEEARTSLHYLNAVFERYPHDFFERSGFPGVVRIARNIQISNHNFNLDGQMSVDGYANLNDQEIVVEFPFDQGHHRFRIIFDHEYYHWRDAQRPDRREENIRWEQMHEACQCQPYSNYKDGEVVSGSESTRSNLTDWFIDVYGSRTPYEDRATMASILMNPLEHAVLLYRLETLENREARESLRARYEAIRTDYHEWSAGAMNDAFWQEIIEQGQREINNRYDEHTDSGSYGYQWDEGEDPRLTDDRPPVQ